jgi:hypothetical protein
MVNPFQLIQRGPVRKKRSKPRRGPERNPAYLAFIRSLQCVCCSGGVLRNRLDWEITEAAHVGPRGFGQKCSDRETIPLCPGHHRLNKDSHHNTQRHFWMIHELDRDELIADLDKRFAADHQDSEDDGRHDVADAKFTEIFEES